MALYFNLHTRMFVQEVAIMNGRKIFYLFHFIVFHNFFYFFTVKIIAEFHIVRVWGEFVILWYIGARLT